LLLKGIKNYSPRAVVKNGGGGVRVRKGKGKKRF